MHTSRLLAPCPACQVGLVTFGTHVHVHEIGFTECPRAYVFRGSKDYSAAQVGDVAITCVCCCNSGTCFCFAAAGATQQHRWATWQRGQKRCSCAWTAPDSAAARASHSHQFEQLPSHLTPSLPSSPPPPCRSRSSWACTARQRSGGRALPAHSRRGQPPAAWRPAQATALCCRWRSASSWSLRWGIGG